MFILLGSVKSRARVRFSRLVYVDVDVECARVLVCDYLQVFAVSLPGQRSDFMSSPAIAQVTSQTVFTMKNL